MLESKETVGRGGREGVDVGEKRSRIEEVEEVVEECFRESGFANAAHAIDAEDESGVVCRNGH